MADNKSENLESILARITPDRKEREIKTLPMVGLSQIGIRARQVAESIMSGQHQSHHYGQNIEFSDYREYVPGDDLRHIDWRAYGRCDRLYIKRFEEETSLRSVILLDISRSMLFGKGPAQKMEYGSNLAAAMATLLVAQKDQVGLALYDEEIRFWLPPLGTPDQLRRVYNQLENFIPKHKTQTGPVLHFLANRFSRRGLLILISDFWDQLDETLRGLNHFAHRKFEILVFHLLTREECEFPYLGSLEIEGLEDTIPLMTDGRTIREGYQRRLKEHTDGIKAGCSRLGVDYNLVVTDEPFDRALLRILSRRRQVTA